MLVVSGSKENLPLDLRFAPEKMGEGSLHPRPEGRGIRDPLRSQCNKPMNPLEVYL